MEIKYDLLFGIIKKYKYDKKEHFFKWKEKIKVKEEEEKGKMNGRKHKRNRRKESEESNLRKGSNPVKSIWRDKERESGGGGQWKARNGSDRRTNLSLLN